MGFLDKIKGWFNIGGMSVKVAVADPQISTGQNSLTATATLATKTDKQVLNVICQVVHLRTYKEEGEKKTDTIVLGNLQYPDGFTLKAGESHDLEFTVEYFLEEKLRHKGGALGALAKMGTFAAGDRDEYWLTVTCDIKGTVFDPSDRVRLKLV